ncbi:hypothetical protein F3Y22_tig00002237pilonHSYRG01697 [Hibiscus syriacus]|uniref:Uncharacterized protein n=1 Tax=Hibiscus syriacus TaxID=106335 RepID=A0A6A3CY82_HIBSY|nr:hypothetical protein F3Y22_tig00002237pilonHSYRG01697 [Hibiscus syriacus]
MFNEPLLTSPSTLGPLNLHNKIFVMDHADADNVKPTEECREVHNVDESDILVGQLFCSRDQAWYFYKGFAREHGFSARKGTTRLDVEGNVKTQEFCCSKEGFRVSKVNIVDRQRAHTPVTRTGCKAKVVVTATNTNDQWVISKSYHKHNHALCTPAMTPFMRSNRAVSKADVDEATTLKEVGVGTSQVMKYLTQQAGGYHNVGFTHKDLYNALQRGKTKEIVDRDVNTLIAYFDYKKHDDPGFFMTFSVDESGALHNLIWLDSTWRSDYTCFGDVITFDTTYKDNLYGRPIMPIVGVNHHHNAIVFATTIIADETSQSFEWTNDAKASAPSYVDLNVSPEVMQMARFAALHSTSSRLCYIASKTDVSFKTARDEMKRLIEELENSFGLNDSVNQSIVVNNVRDPQRKQLKRKEVPKNKVEKKIRRCGYCNSEGHNKLTYPQVKLSLNARTQPTSTNFFEDGIEWTFSPARDDNDLHIS